MVRISVSLRLSSSQRGRQAYCTTCGMSLCLPTASQVSNYPNHSRVLCTLVFPWMLKHIYKIKSTYNGFVVVVVVNCYFIFFVFDPWVSVNVGARWDLVGIKGLTTVWAGPHLPPHLRQNLSFSTACPRCLVNFCGVSCLCLHLALGMLGLCMTLCLFWGSEFRFSQLHGKQVIVHEGRGGEQKGSLQVSQLTGKGTTWGRKENSVQPNLVDAGLNF